MRKELETIALIEHYLGGKLSPEDQVQFEAEMAINDELREEVELQRDLVGAILLAAFADDVKHIHSELVGKPSKTLGKMAWYSLSGFALIAGLTSAMILWNEGEKQPARGKQAHEAPQLAIASTYVGNQPEAKENTIIPPRKKKNGRGNRKTGGRNLTSEAVSFDPDRQRATANLQNFQPSFRNVTMNPNEDFTFKMAESRSTVFIPANSIRNSKGTVTGPVEIRYREYRDAADIAFSKIRMTVHENGEELAFNSAGMFEIFAYQNGERLSLDPEKPMVVDYNVTERLDDLYFWQLKDGSWTKLRSIDKNSYGFPVTLSAGGTTTKKDVPAKEFSSDVTDAGKIKLNIRRTFGDKSPKNVKVKYRSGARWVVESKVIQTDSGYVFDSSPEKDYKIYSSGTKTLKMIDVQNESGKMSALDVWLQPKRRRGLFGIIGRKMESASHKADMKIRGHYEVDTVYILPVTTVKDSTQEQVFYTTANPQAKSGPSAASQQYNNMVGGLSCPDFGVYNCDQTYRIAEKVAISGTFEDENGKAIDSPGMLSVIASGVNGAIAYTPAYFTCSKAGTTLLLFTDDKQIYAMNKEEFDAMNIAKNGSYLLKVRNMTSELLDANDLRHYLGLKEK